MQIEKMEQKRNILYALFFYKIVLITFNYSHSVEDHDGFSDGSEASDIIVDSVDESTPKNDILSCSNEKFDETLDLLFNL
jgi:hypothetical protein